MFSVVFIRFIAQVSLRRYAERWQSITEYRVKAGIIAWIKRFIRFLPVRARRYKNGSEKEIK